MIGVVVRGGPSVPLAPLGVPDDVALAPFAARYRVADFAYASLRNSGIPAAHSETSQSARPGARLLAALRSVSGVAPHEPETPVVVLVADHILDADLRPVLAYQRTVGPDLGLLCVPASIAPVDACVLDVDAHGEVRPGNGPTTPSDLTLTWTGDIVVRAGSLARLLDTLEGRAAASDAAHIGALAGAHRVVAHDLLSARQSERRTYWHEPATIEAYYGAQMDLCTGSPHLDLYDPGWPVLGTGDGLPPAKVVSGESAHAGQALDSLLGDGSVIRGGSVIRSVVGRGVLIDVGAEIEDSLLLDGCRIGRGARVRRAIVGAGAHIGDEEQVGYDDDCCRTAVTERRASGLTLVLPGPPRAVSRPRGSG
jgi:glucose-1-phosphate adenylyltransferase